jgi:hypothetical protein
VRERVCVCERESPHEVHSKRAREVLSYVCAGGVSCGQSQMLAQLAIVMLVMQALGIPGKGGEGWYAHARPN